MTKYTCFRSMSACGIFMLLINLALACDPQCACNSSCGFAYNVTHVSGYEHSNVTLHTSISHSNISHMNVGYWIRYNYPVNSYTICTVSGNNVASTKHNGWFFECNGTSLTLHNLNADHTGSYLFKNLLGLMEHYTVTVLPIPQPPAPQVTTVTNCSLTFFSEHLWRNATTRIITTTTQSTSTTTTSTTKPTTTTHRTTAGRVSTPTPEESSTSTTTEESTTTTWPPGRPKFISKYSKLSVYAAWTAGLFGTALFIFLVVFVCALRHLNNRQGALYRPPPGLPEKDKEKKKTKTTRSGVYHLLPSEKKSPQSTSCAVKSMFS
ncbi:Rh13.1 [macacine betaherpesvirus 3]|nr:Rh13.1 [macacine betaherpesvirus 3]QQL10881.1 Rh13.1 [macacine betaherpesvirus 3]QXV50197.1 membrane protein RL11G [macacine betaherpesvirus 3]